MKASLKIIISVTALILVSCSSETEDTYDYSETTITHSIITRGKYDRFESYDYTLTDGLIVELNGTGGYLANKKGAPLGVYIIDHLFFHYEDGHLIKIGRGIGYDLEYETTYNLSWENENLVEVDYNNSYTKSHCNYVLSYSSEPSTSLYEITHTGLSDNSLIPIDLTLAKKGYFGTWSKNKVEKVTKTEE